MRILNLVLLLLFITVSSSAQDGKFSFTLTKPASTSAGVFSKDGTLVKTLWSNVQYGSGTFTSTWDGKDDSGTKLVRPDADYDIKIISNNIKYEWQGTIGNTSDSMTGDTKHRGIYNCMAGLAFASNGYGYYCNGYSEGVASYYKLLTASPQGKFDFYTSYAGRVITLNTEFVATDNKYVYYGGFDSYSNRNSMVHAIRTSDDGNVIFPKGKPYAVTHGVPYKSVISRVNRTNSRISGLAVQKSGDFLFVARAKLNQLEVLHKTTGKSVRIYNYNSPRLLCIDKNDNLWMVSGVNRISRYTVSKTGALSSPEVSLSGLLEPLATQVSYDGNSIAVADGGSSQQVKFFNNNTGAPGNILGAAGGYFTDATVTDNKFYFSDLKGYDHKYKPVFIAFEPDGSFWVGDGGNSRVQHYSSNRVFIERIFSLGASYSVYVDPNNPTRLWVGALEFAIDYDKPLSGSTGWTLVRNWGANITHSYYDVNKSSSFANPTTLSNGRTYAIIRKTTAKKNREIVEFLPTNQVRFTGVFRTSSQILAPDGAIQILNKSAIGGKSTIYRYALNGFDSKNNPVWSSEPEVVATTPKLTINDPNDILTGNCITSTNKVVIWNPDKFLKGTIIYPGYHLGAINRGGNSWSWKTEQATHTNYRGEYPGAGYFDIGNVVKQYAGGTLSVFGRNLITSYHGEFWKNGQTNKYNHYLDNGLAVGQFGKTKDETSGGAPAEYCGNALTPMVVADPGSPNAMYLYHGDEATHSGIHRWKITDLNTIAEQRVNLEFPTRISPVTAQYVDLMKDLPFSKDVPESIAGWTRKPAKNSKNCNIVTSYYVYDKLAPKDIRFLFSPSVLATYYLKRDLGINNVTRNWKISGDIAWDGRSGNRASMGVFLEVLDKHGRVLTSLYYDFNGGNNRIMVNDQELGLYDMAVTRYLKPFEIEVTGGSVKFSYAGSTPVITPIYDENGKWKTPATLKVRCVAIPLRGLVSNKSINLANLKFYKDYVVNVNQLPIANAGLDKTIPLANNSITLNGSGTDPDGSISEYLWTKILGPGYTQITSPDSATTGVSGLPEGLHHFELTVTDNEGAKSKDTLQVIVNPDPKIANAESSKVPADNHEPIDSFRNNNNSARLVNAAAPPVPVKRDSTGIALVKTGTANPDPVKTVGVVINSKPIYQKPAAGANPGLQPYHTNNLKVFPNPLSTIANLDITTIDPGSKITLRIFNTLGMLVKQKEVFPGHNKLLYKLDMSDLNDGIYFIIVLFNNGQKISETLYKGTGLKL